MRLGRWLLLGLLIAGCRLGYVLLSDEGKNPPVADAQVYVDMASNLAHGKGLQYQGLSSIRPPAYMIFLAALFKASGDSLPAGQVAQVLLALLTGFLLFEIAAFYYDEKIAWLACLIYAVSYDSYVVPATFLSENLYAFLLVLSVYWLSLEKYIPAAFSLTACYFTRQESFLFIAFLLAYYAYENFSRNFKKIAAISAVLFIFESAWICRNWRIHHKLIAGTTFSEAHLFLSNAYIFQRLGYGGDIEKKVALAGVPEMQLTRINREAVRSLFRDQPPHRFFLAPFLKLGFFLYPFLPAYDISYMLILPFWLLGLYQERRQWPRNHLLYGAFAPLLGLLLIFHAVPRYRGPFYPFIALFAAACLWTLWSRDGRSRALISGWCAVNIILLLAAEPVRHFVKDLLP